ncbi:MAG: GNAT family N-acetyltransferase [Spirochaetia bacterium]
MIWKRVDQDTFTDLLRFILPLEHICVNFTSRLLQHSRPALPSPRESVVFIGINGGKIAAAVLVTSKGLLIPVHSDNLSLSAEQIQPLLTQVYRYVRRLYCLIGIEDTVRQYENLLKSPIDVRRSHYLMVRPKTRHLSPLHISADIHIHSLSEKDVRRVFPLEKAYQFEEVVVHPEHFNPSAYMLHFRKVVKTQRILFATLDTTPISKAGTNAIGINYTQIGGVYTAPEHRGHGVARALMHRLIEEIQATGRNSVLFVRTSNRSAIQLYRRLNFDIVGRYQISYTRLE